MYDLSELREMSGNDEEFVKEMLDTFLVNNEDYLRLLNEAFQNQDWKTLKFNAHKIKPSILLFKIDSLKQEILELNEYSGKEIELDKIPGLVAALNKGLSAVFERIKKEM